MKEYSKSIDEKKNTSKVSREELELTANLLGTHIETHSGLILRTLSYLTVNSQDYSHCEVAVNFP